MGAFTSGRTTVVRTHLWYYPYKDIYTSGRIPIGMDTQLVKPLWALTHLWSDPK